MAEITAGMVKSLRERSGLPMMDCKAALNETGGDEAAAMELLRKRGAAAAEKKAGRATAEGRIGSYRDAGKGIAALVEVQCETAPVANNPDFRALVDKLAKHVAASGTLDIEKIKSEKFVDDPKVTVTDLMHDVLNRLRENMTFARAARIEGRSGLYVHHDGRIGVLIGVEGSGGDEALLSDLCMHIAAIQPAAISRADIPADTVAKEQEIIREQVAASGKPAAMIDKITSGKLDRWFSERVLEEQPFVKDDKKSVGEVCKQAGIKVTRFVRLRVGESK